MSRHQNPTFASEFFSHHALVLSYRLLRPTHPELALLLQQTLDQIHFAPYDSFRGLHTGEMHFNCELLKLIKADQVGLIVAALTEVGETALQNTHTSQNYMNLLRSLIDDWVQLMEWILMEDAELNYQRFVN